MNLLLIGSISGCLVVILGAFGAHYLKNVLDDYTFSIYEKAILYQMFHSIGLILVALIDKNYHLDLFYSGWMFIVGIMLVSEGGHLAHLTLFGQEITPMSKATFYFVISILIIIDIVQSKYQKNLLNKNKS